VPKIKCLSLLNTCSARIKGQKPYCACAVSLFGRGGDRPHRPHGVGAYAKSYRVATVVTLRQEAIAYTTVTASQTKHRQMKEIVVYRHCS